MYIIRFEYHFHWPPCESVGDSHVMLFSNRVTTYGRESSASHLSHNTWQQVRKINIFPFIYFIR